jgi:hypothetical protein
MARVAKSLGASKTATSLLVLFIPSVDRESGPVDQDFWVEEALRVLGATFGGATAFPRGRGVWRDDELDRLVFDDPVVIQCYTSAALIEAQADVLKQFLVRMGTETRQGAVGLVIDRQYLEIRFPLKEKP